MNVFDRMNHAIERTEGSLVNLLSALAPWGAPLAPAYMAYNGMSSKLGFESTVALIIAGVIEILGLATVSTTIQFWQHNRRYKAEFRKMPVIIPAGMFSIYLAVVITVNVLLELPDTADNIYVPTIARALLSLLSIPAAVTLAVRTQYTQLREEIASSRIRAKLEREEVRSSEISSGTEQNQLRSSAIEPFYCEFCGSPFTSQNALNAHKRKHKANLSGSNGRYYENEEQKIVR